MNRRGFMRFAVLGALGAGLAALVVRRPAAKPGETCVNQGLCRGCASLPGCGLPTALSMKAAAKEPGG